MPIYPDDDPKTLAEMDTEGYEEARKFGEFIVFMCEDCASTFATYRANTIIARPHLAKQYCVGFLRAWREMHATFEKKWPYV